MVLVCNRPDLADELLAGLTAPRNRHLARRLAAIILRFGIREPWERT